MCIMEEFEKINDSDRRAALSEKDSERDIGDRRGLCFLGKEKPERIICRRI